MPASNSRRLVRRGIGAIAVIALIVAMALSTKFLTPEEVKALSPEKFDPAKTAADLVKRAPDELDYAALGQVVPDIQSDVKAAADKHGAIKTSDTAYAFPVSVEGKVTQASEASIQVEVNGVPQQTKVIIPLTTAVNGTVLRDAMGFKFADAPGQTAYQQVGDEIKKLTQQKVNESVDDAAALKGKTIKVEGVMAVQATGKAVPKPKPLNVQIVTIEAGS